MGVFSDVFIKTRPQQVKGNVLFMTIRSFRVPAQYDNSFFIYKRHNIITPC